MDKLTQLGIGTAIIVFVCIFVGATLWRKMKATHLPFHYSRNIYTIGLMVSAFLTYEAAAIVYIYHLSWINYFFIALFMLFASVIISYIAKRVYKRDHPNEPTNVKRPTFREAYRAANGKTDVVSLILGLAFLLALFSSQIFHQMIIYYLALPFVMGPWMLYDGTKMLRQAQAEQQPYDIHWYIQYKIWFGVGAILSLPSNLVMYGPLAFVRTAPYHDQIENGLTLLFVIPVFASAFFFLRKQYLKRRNRISSDQS